jgi:iron complex outermembrane receptor protein
MNTKNNQKALAAIVGAVVALQGTSALAQDDSIRTLEEIVVTATKRATSIQDTPLAISAFDASTLEENHVSNIFDLRGMAPSLQIRANGDHNVPLVFIRGQGTINQTEAGDPAVAFYTDGIFAARSQGSIALMYDMERVEVLRGPQGTLFGRNSTAGAIALHTAKPSDTFEAEGSLTMGSRDRQEVKMMVNTPITENWAMRFAGVTDEQKGETRFTAGNQFQGQEQYGTKDVSSYRISSLYTPSENLSWNLSYESYSNQGTGDVPTRDPDYRQNDATAPGAVDLNSESIRTRVDYEMGNDLTLSYIGGYTDMDQAQLYGSEHNGDYRATTSSGHSATQHELQLKNSDDSAFRWTAGLFSFEEDNDIRFDIPHGSWGFTGQDQGTVLSTFVQPSRGLDSTSAYVQGTYDVSDDFRVTAGLRHTEDEREDVGGRSIDCTYDPGRDALPAIAASAADLNGGQGCYFRQINDMDGSWSNTTYLARAEWDLSDDVLIFMSYATGWKSGVLADGQNVNTTGSPVNTDASPDIAGNNLIPQQPEENDSLELGIKSTLLDGRMTLNANLFFMDYTDMQVTAAVINPVTGQSTLTSTNAGSATINGLEFTMNYAVGAAGTLAVTGSFLDATYDDFDGSETNYSNAAGLQWNPCSFGTSDAGTCVGGVFDYSGNTLPNAPEMTLNVSYKHEFQLDNGAVLTPRVRLSYQDDTYLTQENRGDRPAGTNGPTDPGEANFDTQDAYAKIDFSLAYQSADSRWGAELYVNNATDEDIKEELAINGGQDVTFATYAPSREAGLRLNFSFD